MAPADLVKVRVGQTALPARRAGENELVIEDLLALDPGDAITVDGQAMVVVHAEAKRNVPGPHGPVPQTRVTFRPASVDAASPGQV